MSVWDDTGAAYVGPRSFGPGVAPTSGPGVPVGGPQQGGGGPFDPDPNVRAQWLYDNINSTISMPQWQAWANLADPKCPPGRPFRTQKQVDGGDQNECVETPDNCPEGTSAFGANRCISVQDPRISGAGGPGGQTPGQGGPGGATPGIGLADLVGNMTFQSMFRNITPQQAGGISQVGTGNQFNLGNGQQGRVLNDGAFMWGDPNGFNAANPAAAQPLNPGSFRGVQKPATTQPGMFDYVNNMVRKGQRTQVPQRTLSY